MPLPLELQQAIEEEIERFGLRDIKEAREELTDRYRHRQPGKQHFMTTEAHRCAYVAARLPATYAVNYRILKEVHQRLADVHVRSLLDLGAGPGTATWAASEVFQNIEKAVLVEKDVAIAALGQRFAKHSSHHTLQSAGWQFTQLESLTLSDSYDLIILSYSIGELPEEAIHPLIQKCWEAGHIIVVIEPGTPQGFERIRTVRGHLITLGGHIVAPCPHMLACPMTGGDWCHFSERVERTSLHRRLKGGALGYEDEKYSYIVASKTPCELPKTRVLSHPMKRSGHIGLKLCTSEGLKNEIISKRYPEDYRQAKKTEWGSPYPDDLSDISN